MDVVIPAAFAFGLLSGFRHAFEPDHVVAVSTLLHEKSRLASAVLTGLAWGAGHSTVLLVGVVAVTALQIEISPEQSALMELPVAAMLIGLGVWTLASSVRRTRGLHRHTHDSIPHMHVGDHPHPHSFPTSWRGFSVGLVHGFAGTGALLLLVGATLPTVWHSILFALIFGIGSLLGMAVVSTALALPLLAARSRPYLFSSLTGLCGILSVGFGVFIVFGVFA